MVKTGGPEWNIDQAPNVGYLHLLKDIFKRESRDTLPPTNKCKNALSKRKVVVLQGSVHFHVSWWEGIFKGNIASPLFFASGSAASRQWRPPLSVQRTKGEYGLDRPGGPRRRRGRPESHGDRLPPNSRENRTLRWCPPIQVTLQEALPIDVSLKLLPLVLHTCFEAVYHLSTPALPCCTCKGLSGLESRACLTRQRAMSHSTSLSPAARQNGGCMIRAFSYRYTSRNQCASTFLTWMLVLLQKREFRSGPPFWCTKGYPWETTNAHMFCSKTPPLGGFGSCLQQAKDGIMQTSMCQEVQRSLPLGITNVHLQGGIGTPKGVCL